MKITRLAALLSVSVLFFSAGCGTPAKIFKITSFPSGATIYLDGKSVGQTAEDGKFLNVTFEKPLRTIRLERANYQSAGIVLSVESPDEIAFFLQIAPSDDDEIKKLLREINQGISNLPTKISDTIKKKSE